MLIFKRVDMGTFAVQLSQRAHVCRALFREKYKLYKFGVYANSHYEIMGDSAPDDDLESDIFAFADHSQSDSTMEVEVDAAGFQLPKRRRPGRPPKKGFEDSIPKKIRMQPPGVSQLPMPSSSSLQSHQHHTTRSSHSQTQVPSISLISNSQSNQNKTLNNNKSHNVLNNSSKMKSILHKTFNHVSYFNTTQPNTTRTQMADIWAQVSTNSDDIILKNASGFVLKSNEEISTLNIKLTSLQQKNIISNYSVKASNTNYIPRSERINNSFSVIIANVESDITDEIMLNHLKNNDYNIRMSDESTAV